jgi:hypothetical protein
MNGADDWLLAVLVDEGLRSGLAADAEALNSFINHLANGPGIGAATTNAFDTPPGEMALLAVLCFAGRVEDYFDAYDMVEKLLGQRLAGWDAYQGSPNQHHARWMRSQPATKGAGAESPSQE